MMHRSALALLCLAALPGALAAAEIRVINSDAEFPEGPFWGDGKLYYAEYGGNRVSVWDGMANRVLWTQEGCGPSAVLPFGGGWLVTCYDNGTLVQIGADGAAQRVWDKDASGAALVGPNDATADGRGGAYVTASGLWETAPIVGKVYHLAPDGALTPVADDLHIPTAPSSRPTARCSMSTSPRPGASSPSRCRRTAALPTGGCSSA